MRALGKYPDEVSPQPNADTLLGAHLAGDVIPSDGAQRLHFGAVVLIPGFCKRIRQLIVAKAMSPIQWRRVELSASGEVGCFLARPDDQLHSLSNGQHYTNGQGHERQVLHDGRECGCTGEERNNPRGDIDMRVKPLLQLQQSSCTTQAKQNLEALGIFHRIAPFVLAVRVAVRSATFPVFRRSPSSWGVPFVDRLVDSHSQLIALVTPRLSVLSRAFNFLVDRFEVICGAAFVSIVIYEAAYLCIVVVYR